MMTEHEKYALALHIMQRIRAGWLPHRVGGNSWWWGRPREGGFDLWAKGLTPSMSIVEEMSEAEVIVWTESLHPMAPETILTQPRLPPNEVAPWLLKEVIEHGDENGGLANATGDELRDALALAAERIRELVRRWPGGAARAQGTRG